jgi:hypothetical protein
MFVSLESSGFSVGRSKASAAIASEARNASPTATQLRTSVDVDPSTLVLAQHFICSRDYRAIRKNLLGPVAGTE